MDKIKNRLLGANREEKRQKVNVQTAALIAQEDKITGKHVLRVLQRYGVAETSSKTLLEQAGLKLETGACWCICVWRCPGRVRGWAGCSAFAAPALAVMPALAVGLFPAALRHCIRSKKRLHKFEEQFPESLEFVARSMRAGHAFSVSLEMIHREFQEPLAGEFRRTFEEHNLGLASRRGAAEAGQARAFAGRALLRLGRDASEAHRR
ncbi:MAG: hypothetical protein QM757_25485 [Paludibaculum sp.]